MRVTCAVLLGLVAVVAAHYEGYPFIHQNKGKYGAKYPYANYRSSQKDVAGTPKVYQAPVGGYAVGFVPDRSATGKNLEFQYRQHGGYAVHLGNGQFHFLGSYAGQCGKDSYGFYFTEEETSYQLCDHGRIHKFQCPRGTKNRKNSFDKQHQPYTIDDMCSVNLNDKKP